MKNWCAAASTVVALSGASPASAAVGDIGVATPPPGFTNTYLVDVGSNRILGIDGTVRYEWWWNVPHTDENGFTGEFFLDWADAWTGAGCSGEWSCSGTRTFHGQAVTTAFGLAKWGEWGKYLVRVSNRVTRPDFNACDTVGDAIKPCAMYWEQPNFGVYVESWGIPGVSVTLRSSTAVPEPASWAMMILGFGLTGAGLRKSRAPRRTQPSLQPAS